ncbi:hypothetical protein QR680_017284 [Steinernema hermaphroditum]|uniref:Uncharacterized protein n=1 Tax=Steinernema hermaphroditum TaxID=289476 RepID=A0AA39LNU9_9BILA|nr:hypothetical protein QR680_017284 [Steinernema hermaphroditum]
MVVDGAASGVFRAVIFDMGDVMLRYHDCEDGLRVLSKMKKYPEITPFKKGLNLGHISTEELSVIVKQKVAEEVRTHFDRLTLEDTRHGPDILTSSSSRRSPPSEGADSRRRSSRQTTLRRLGLDARECFFVYDLEENCVAAEALGIRSVLMSAGKSKWTIEKVEPLPRVPLLG